MPHIQLTENVLDSTQSGPPFFNLKNYKFLISDFPTLMVQESVHLKSLR
jgi:hypothetical protein